MNIHTRTHTRKQCIFKSLIDVDLNIPCDEIGNDHNIIKSMKKLQEKYQKALKNLN